MPPPQLTYDEQGRQLCRICYGGLREDNSLENLYAADEYRKCAHCSTVVEPDYQTGMKFGRHAEFEDGEVHIAVFTRRVYDCPCGKSFFTWSWRALATFSALGLLGVFQFGIAFRDGELEHMLAWTLLAVWMLPVLWDVITRYQHPRAKP